MIFNNNLCGIISLFRSKTKKDWSQGLKSKYPDISFKKSYSRSSPKEIFISLQNILFKSCLRNTHVKYNLTIFKLLVISIFDTLNLDYYLPSAIRIPFTCARNIHYNCIDTVSFLFIDVAITIWFDLFKNTDIGSYF
jgi:hypothetical protein